MRVRSRGAYVLRGFMLFVLFPIILLGNACSLIFSEQRDAASSGFLTAKVMLLNPGAMSDFSGDVWVLPQYFPPIWPFDLLVGCRALSFDSDPRVEVEWDASTLVINHDPFTKPVTQQSHCYGRPIILRKRSDRDA